MKGPAMCEAFAALDRKLSKPLTLLVGGGAAMTLAHRMPLATDDVDGLPLDTAIGPAELDPLIKGVARELGISAHWYNDYFNAFTWVLPPDFRERLAEVFRGKRLTVKALGKEDLLVMKCMAGREKDIGHARALLKRGADHALVERQLERLAEKGLAGAVEALRFLEDLIAERGG